MSHDSSMPASIGVSRPDEAPTVEPDAALLRLHAALRNLDDSIFDALRALEAALGREITTQPESNLPYREMGRLRDQLDAARGMQPGPRRHSFAELAIEIRHDDDDHDDDHEDEGDDE
jgi:hypothetical protein